MNACVLIQTFDRQQTEFLLMNHELYSENEVKIAAKRMVKLDKDEAFRMKMAGRLVLLERENSQARYDADMRALMYQDEGFNNSLSKSLFGFSL